MRRFHTLHTEQPPMYAQGVLRFRSHLIHLRSCPCVSTACLKLPSGCRARAGAEVTCCGKQTSKHAVEQDMVK